MKVTLGIPVFNGEDYLSDAINSIREQTFDDYEVIISDNCSTDRTGQICQDYASADSRVQYIRQPENIGSSGNFNFLAKMANGEYFRWCAADDMIRPTYLEKCVEVMNNDASVVLCHTLTKLIDELGNPLKFDESTGQYFHRYGEPRLPPPLGFRAASNRPVERFEDIMKGTPPCYDIFGLIRSDALKATTLHWSYYGTDRVVLLELALSGKFQEVPEVLFYKREHPAQSNLSRSPEELQEYIDPNASRPRIFGGRDFYKQSLLAVYRSPLSIAEKMGCLVVLQKKMRLGL